MCNLEKKQSYPSRFKEEVEEDEIDKIMRMEIPEANVEVPESSDSDTDDEDPKNKKKKRG